MIGLGLGLRLGLGLGLGLANPNPNVGSNSQVGSEGFSVCVGELPDAGFGESGGGTGLRVNFKTAYNGLYEMLELWYAEVMLHQVWTSAWLGLGSGLGLGLGLG